MDITNEGKSLLELQVNCQFLKLVDELLTARLLVFGSLATKVTNRTGMVRMKDILNYIDRSTELSCETIVKERIEEYIKYLRRFANEFSFGLCEAENNQWSATKAMDSFLLKLDFRIIITYDYLKEGASRVALCSILGKQYAKWLLIQILT